MSRQRLYTGHKSAIDHPGEFSDLLLHSSILGFTSTDEMLESGSFASANPSPQVLPPAADVLLSSGTAEGSRRCGVGVEKVPPVAPGLPSLPSSRGEVRDESTGILHRKAGSISVSLILLFHSDRGSRYRRVWVTASSRLRDA